jgi:hypothetical protein
MRPSQDTHRECASARRPNGEADDDRRLTIRDEVLPGQAQAVESIKFKVTPERTHREAARRREPHSIDLEPETIKELDGMRPDSAHLARHMPAHGREAPILGANEVSAASGSDERIAEVLHLGQGH